MTKKMLSVRASDLAIGQLTELAARWGTSQAETLTVIVDRVYREERMLLHQNDVLMEVEMDRILQWDYAGTGDIAPWDYEAGLTGATGREDAIAFIVEYNWKIPAKDNPKGFEIAFEGWRDDVIERRGGA